MAIADPLAAEIIMDMAAKVHIAVSVEPGAVCIRSRSGNGGSDVQKVLELLSRTELPESPSRAADRIREDLDDYLNDVSSCEPLSSRKYRRLIRRIHRVWPIQVFPPLGEGWLSRRRVRTGIEAFDEVFESSLGLVVSVVTRISTVEELGDSIVNSNDVVVRAIREYESTSPQGFIEYARAMLEREARRWHNPPPEPPAGVREPRNPFPPGGGEEVRLRIPRVGPR